MSVGDMLLILAALSALVAIIGGGMGLLSKGPRYARLSRYSCLIAFALVTAVFAFLALLFLTSDLSYYYVWSHSSTDLDPGYKLVGVWAGGEGGLVLWTWFMALFLTVEVLMERRRTLNSRFSAALRVAASCIVLLFTLILLAADLFQRTTEADLLLHPAGLGMNLSLQTAEMAVHPPLVFAAYAACLILFSASLARLVVDDDRWTEVALPWSRIAGTLLFAGITVGAVWAYYELGWGGFWVWDPVETASLLPLIAVIAFLHSRRSPGAAHGPLMPFLGMLSFVLVLLASFITRTGGLWGSSVHTYGSTVTGSLGTRFVTVLTGDMSVMGLFTVILVLFILSFFLSYRLMRTVGKGGRVKNDVLLTVALLLMFIVLLLLLLVKNTGLDQGQNFVEFTEKVTMLSFAMMTLLLFSLLVGKLGRKGAMAAGAVIVVLSAVLAVLSSLTGSLPWLVGLILPPAGAVMALSAYHLALIDQRDLHRWIGHAAGHVVHLGVAIIFVCFIMSSTMQTSLPEGPATVNVGGDMIIGDHVVHLESLTRRPWTTSTGDPGEERIATLLVYTGSDRATVTVSNFYQNDSAGSILVRSGTAIVNGLAEDVYINYEWKDNGTAGVQARVIPLVSEVWLGFSIATLGMIATLAGRDEDDPIY
ncbi:MAG: cytochrome c biogenesis protein CcsA [Methanomassiliicoccus sp.]|nr:cytochrome c biogenesis protein CcsA [Methanomassiliicoccus sp.]